jgi:hypothetical protein
MLHGIGVYFLFDFSSNSVFVKIIKRNYSHTDDQGYDHQYIFTERRNNIFTAQFHENKKSGE